MNYYALTDIGKVRNKNQDQATVIANVKDQVIAIVCDGMGGHRAGEIASRVVMDQFVNCFDSIPPFDNVDELKKWVSNEPGQQEQGQGTSATPILRAAEAYLIYLEAYYERHGNLGGNCDRYWTELRRRAGVDTDYNKTIAATDLF